MEAKNIFGGSKKKETNKKNLLNFLNFLNLEAIKIIFGGAKKILVMIKKKFEVK